MVSRESFEIYKCKSCETLSTHPVPKDLSPYYDSTDYLSHHSNKNDILSTVYRFIRSININNKINILNSYATGKDLLDVGCGTGDFLDAAKKKLYNVAGMEVDKDAAAITKQKIGKDIYHSLDEINTTFDTISLWHVLEHMEDPSRTLAIIHTLINDNGICIIAVPNYKSDDAQRYKTFWAGFDVPRHLYHFSQKSIQHLATQTNFIIEATHPMPFDAYYVSLLSEKYQSPSVLNYFNAIKNGLQSNIAANKSTEYSSLIYILRKQ
jgi:2-polyprenyl-3-methyl-5-hydroxy-6-metoxy-1,4-benzoquinol methylase